MKFLRTPEHEQLMSKLVEARHNQKLTQQQLADLVGEPQNFVCKYETGERRLDVFELVVVSRPLSFDWAGAVREIEAKYGPIVNPRTKPKPPEAGEPAPVTNSPDPDDDKEQ